MIAPTNFTFGDDSTLTSFTEVRKHPEDLSGIYEDSTVSVSGAYQPTNYDCRSEEEETRGHSEVSQRDYGSMIKSEWTQPNQSIPDGNSSKIQSDWTHHSRRSNESHQSSQFWATLSVYAASAAMSSSWNKKMKEAAASAAAKSLLEDGQVMERINTARREHQLRQEEKQSRQRHRHGHGLLLRHCSRQPVS